jgi:hypothetical protein
MGRADRINVWARCAVRIAGSRAAGLTGAAGRRAGALLIALALVGFAAPAAAQAAFSWSAPVALDTDGGPPLEGIACPSSTQCTAVDNFGREITFNPTSSTAPLPVTIDDGNSLGAVACPTTSQCTAVDSDGFELTFDPASPLSPAPTPVALGSGGMTAIACPSTSQCTAVDAVSQVITFNPNSPGDPSRTQAPVDRIAGLACPSSTQCTTATGWFSDGEITLNPQAPGTLSVGATLAGSDYPGGVACPSLSECVVVDSVGVEFTFNPASPGTPAATTIAKNYPFDAVACQSTTACVAIDTDGDEVAFNPISGVAMSPVTIDKDTALSAVTCVPAGGSCTAVDAVGRQVTFDPAAPGTPSVNSIDSGNLLTGVGCVPAASQCAAVDDIGQQVDFNPASPGTPAPAPSVIDTQPLNAVACPASTECVALDSGRSEVVTNPGSYFPPQKEPIGGEGRLASISCPATTQCTTVDNFGAQFTFNPSIGGYNYFQNVDGDTPAGAMTAVSCPSTSQCTAVDGGGREITFDPDTSSPSTVQTLDGISFEGVACPSTTQCTAVDYFGREVTFDPLSLATPALVPIDPQAELLAIACPSTTLCLAVDSAGRALEGNPLAGGSWTIEPVAGMNSLESVSCPSSAQCVVVDAVGDVSVATAGGLPGNESPPTISGDAVQAGTLTASPGVWPGAPALTDQWYDCDPGGSSCFPIAGATGSSYTPTAADVEHTLRVEETASPSGYSALSAPTAMVTASTGPQPAPVDSSPPTISGATTEGQTLTDINGAWSGSPSAYAYQWEDCDTSGLDCQVIAGATGQTYTLSPGDVHATIRVVETASNGGGAGNPATSAQTAVVAGLSGAAPAGGSSTTGGGGGGVGHTALAPPDAELLKAQIDAATHSATFHFKASGSSTGFECALIREPARRGAKAHRPVYAVCETSKTFRHLAAGSYELFVRAVGPGGASVTPATRRFTIA